MGNEDRPEIIEVSDVHVVMQNTDRTEGRGVEKPIHVCALETTAIRLSHKKGVQGSDARVVPSKSLKVEIDGKKFIYIPGTVEQPTKEDKENQSNRDAVASALAKAKAAGLTDEELEILRGGR